MDFVNTLYLFVTILFAWAVINIVLWWKMFRTSKDLKKRYIAQMSAMWNVVNAGIALSAFWVLSRNSQLIATDSGLASGQMSIVAWNIYADLAYIIIGYFGFYLWRKSKDSRRKWYSVAVVGQGLFLLVLDAVFLASLNLAYFDQY
jgi:cytochrome bd-type quinol oxidase subunit 2